MVIHSKYPKCGDNYYNNNFLIQDNFETFKRNICLNNTKKEIDTKNATIA